MICHTRSSRVCRMLYKPTTARRGSSLTGRRLDELSARHRLWWAYSLDRTEECVVSDHLSTYLIVNALVRDETGNKLVLVRQKAHTGCTPRWAVPGGKVDPGESLGTALQRELAEETGLGYSARPTIAYTVHYLLQSDPLTHVVVYVFDGPGSGVSAALEAGPTTSPDPEGDVVGVELVPLTRAVELLAEAPEVIVRSPVVAYLTGACPPGSVWSFTAEDSTEAAQVITPSHRPACL